MHNGSDRKNIRSFARTESVFPGEPAILQRVQRLPGKRDMSTAKSTKIGKEKVAGKNRKESGAQGCLIFLCWLVYTISYLSRYSYNSNIVAIRGVFGADNAAAGLVGSMFFFAYGAGQIINGIFCKKYPKRLIVSLALGASAAFNIAAGLLKSFAPFKFLWLINGAVLSLLWSSLILILGENLSETNLKKAIFAMSTTVPAGMIVIYGFAAVCNRLGAFRPVFFFAGVATFIVAAVWFMLYGKVSAAAKAEALAKDAKTAAKAEAGEAETSAKKAALESRTKERVSEALEKADGAEILTGRTAEAPAEASGAQDVKKKAAVPVEGSQKRFGVPAVFFVLAGFAIVCNFVKDGLGTWLPAILKDSFGFGDGLSVALTLVLPILGIFSASVALVLHKKLDNFSAELSLEFALAAVMLAAVLAAVGYRSAALAVGCFGLTSLFMHAVNNVITNMAPLMLREKMNPGFSAGLLNGFCYVGSTLSGYLLGAFSDAFGWNKTMTLLLILTAAAAVIAAGIAFLSRKKSVGRK